MSWQLAAIHRRHEVDVVTMGGWNLAARSMEKRKERKEYLEWGREVMRGVRFTVYGVYKLSTCAG